MKPSPAYRHLAQRLSEAEATVAALLSGQVDAVIEPGSKTPLLLANAQSALRVSEARFRQERDRAQRYLDTAAVMLVKLDLDGRIELVNRYACDTLGWTADELLGRNWIATCIPAGGREAMQQMFDNVLKGDLRPVENLVMTRSGAERLIEWCNTLERDDAGNVVGTFSSGTDVTDRNRATEALRAAEERMRFALEAAAVGIWDMDYRTGIVQWSETLEAQYGLEPGTFTGRFDQFVDAIHTEDRASVLETLQRAEQAGSDFRILHRVIWPDGTVHWCSGAGRIRLDEHGQPLRGVGISIDVTDRQLAEQGTQQRQKMEAVGRLASGVAHDFNNLLTVILGFAEFVSEDVGIVSQHGKDMSEIIKAAHRAMGLTRQLLAFSRQQVMQPASLDVNDVLQEMSGMLRRLIGEQIDVSLHPGRDVPAVLADRSQMEQVVMNLVVNAKDAMADGGRITITSAAVTLADNQFGDEAVIAGDYVLLTISDTGAGMTQDVQRRLFEPFFTTKQAGKGTGLGLSTTYGIVKQSKGYIRVSSTEGRGTTFSVYLPCYQGQPVGADPDADAVAPTGGNAKTVLIVEDEESVRGLSRRVLKNAGYRVLEAANGNDAEELFLKHAASIDLVLTDMVMPGCGGPALVNRLRRHSPDVNVLYMSGYTDPADAGFASDEPFNLLQKPFSAVELSARVSESMKNGTRRNEATR